MQLTLVLYLVLAFLTFLTCTSASQCMNGTDYSCRENNRSAALSFVKPVGQERISLYPATDIFGSVHRLAILSCCATGFSSITWYKDGVELSPSSNDLTHCYVNDTTRQWLSWYSIEANSPDKAAPLISSIFTCKVYSADNTTSISSNTTVLAINMELPEDLPVFSKATAVDSCVEPGGDINIECSLTYNRFDWTYSRRIALLDQNKTDILLGKGQTSFNATALATEGHLGATIHNVSEEWLNKTYYCRSISHSSLISRPIFISEGPCGGVVVTNRTITQIIEHPLSIMISVPMAVLVVLGVILIVLVVRYNTYVNMWYRVRVVQPLRSSRQSDTCKYAAYMVYADISHPAVSTLITTIEQRFKLKLCLPDRDFTVGAITPELMSEGLKSSEKIIIFLSNDMFTTDETGTNWSDVSLSLSLALDKPIIMIRLEDIQPNAVKKRKDLGAALKILKILNYSSADYNQQLSEALVTNFEFQI